MPHLKNLRTRRCQDARGSLGRFCFEKHRTANRNLFNDCKPIDIWQKTCPPACNLLQHCFSDTIGINPYRNQINLMKAFKYICARGRRMQIMRNPVALTAL